jgi:hypothetical protein
MRRLQQILLVAVLILGISNLAQATTYVWNFDVPTGDVGSSTHIYKDTTNTYALTAYGYLTENGPTTTVVGTSTWGPGGGFTNNTGTITPHNLYGKLSTPDETGLGLTGETFDNEIQYRSFVQLDLTDLYNHGFNSLHMYISSIQTDEGYYLWGSNVQGVPGVLLQTSVNPPEVQDFDIPDFGTYTYFSISATPIVLSSSDVLIRNGLSANQVPVPPSMLLLGSGLLGLVGLRKRMG